MIGVQNEIFGVLISGRNESSPYTPLFQVEIFGERTYLNNCKKKMIWKVYTCFMEYFGLECRVIHGDVEIYSANFVGFTILYNLWLKQKIRTCFCLKFIYGNEIT